MFVDKHVELKNLTSTQIFFLMLLFDNKKKDIKFNVHNEYVSGLTYIIYAQSKSKDLKAK